MFSFEPVLYSPISHWSLALQGFWFARVPAVLVASLPKQCIGRGFVPRHTQQRNGRSHSRVSGSLESQR
jgi:hypothetical protein